MTVPAVLPPIEVPQLSGGRERARALVDGLADRMGGATIVVDFRRMVAGTPSFADELGEYLLEAARDHGVAERLQTA
jgi:hypothetical protein